MRLGVEAAVVKGELVQGDAEIRDGIIDLLTEPERMSACSSPARVPMSSCSTIASVSPACCVPE